MTTFVPNSTFGRKVLQSIFEAEATRISGWLLNVPADAPGDRRTWTWEDNWKNYRVQNTIAYSTTTNVIDVDTRSVNPPSAITLFEEGVHISPGAFYVEGPGKTNNNSNTYFFNTGTETITFTHYAIFVQESKFSSLRYEENPNSERTNQYLAGVRSFSLVDEDPVTLGPGQVMYLFFNPATPEFFSRGKCGTYDSFASFVQADKDYSADFFSGTNLYAGPHVSGRSPTTHYYLNKQESPFFIKSFNNLLQLYEGVTTTGFFAELLNVTDYEPLFDAPWSDWEAYTINRFAISVPNNEFKFTGEEGSYVETVTFNDEEGNPEEEFSLLIELEGTKVNLKETQEFTFGPPSSGSYTYTHVAVFLQPGVELPVQGNPYTHSDTDLFVGVIRLAAPITMTTTSTARAYPFNLGLVYNPALRFEEL
jgi:hypothetical protein